MRDFPASWRSSSHWENAMGILFCWTMNKGSHRSIPSKLFIQWSRKYEDENDDESSLYYSWAYKIGRQSTLIDDWIERKWSIVDDHWITDRHIFNIILNMILSICRHHHTSWFTVDDITACVCKICVFDREKKKKREVLVYTKWTFLCICWWAWHRIAIFLSILIHLDQICRSINMELSCCLSQSTEETFNFSFEI